MNLKNIFSKVFSKEALIIIDVIVCPVLTLVFSNFITTLIPQFIFDFNDGFLELPFRLGILSIPISLIYFVALLSLKKERLLKLSIFTLIGIVGSLTIGVAISGGLVMLLYMLGQVFGYY